MEMTSRERVRLAINHQEPDRIPIDFGGTKVTGVHVDEYIAIGEYLGIDVELPKVYETFQMLARVEEPILSWLHSDVIQLENLSEAWNYQNKNWKPWTTTAGHRVLVPGEFNAKAEDDGTIELYSTSGNVIAKMGATSLYFDKVSKSTALSNGDFPLMDPQKWKDSIELYSDEELSVLQKRAKFLHEFTDYSIHGGCLRGKLGSSAMFAGHSLEDWLCLLLIEPEYTHEILQATAEKAVENFKLYIEAVGDYIDTILISTTDFGSQRCEMFSSEIFAEQYEPNYKMMCDYIHAHSEVKTMLHSCGSIRNIIPSFIRAGVDILNPIQFNTDGMDIVELKEQFGNNLVFWGGGVDTQYVLPNGTDEEVIEQIERHIRVLGKGGGAIFTPVHNLQYDVSPERVELMVSTVLKHGQYPL